jgi:Na+/H+-dicarboxylate symporter
MTDRRIHVKPKIPLYIQILIAMALGLVVGLIFGKPVGPLGELGKIVIQLIRVLAAPLLFFAIVDAFLRTEMEGRRAAWLVVICSINTFFALIIGLGISNILQPGRHRVLPEIARTSEPTAVQTIDFLKAFTGYVPNNIVQPFLENSVLSIVLLALLVGGALRKLKNDSTWAEHSKLFETFVAGCFRATEIILSWIIKLIPLAVFGVIAKVVGEQGLEPLKGLGVYVGVALLGLFLHVAIVYQLWIVLVARDSLKRFWTAARDAIVYAIGASSSLATLPVTLKSIDKLGVSPASARMAACVGTNFNNDGILLYEAMAVLFVAQVHGIHLDLSQQVIAAISCVVAGVGIAGVPEAGLISLSLVLATVGLPVEILPLLLTVDWILSRARATTNVISDILVALLLDKLAIRKSGTK